MGRRGSTVIVITGREERQEGTIKGGDPLTIAVQGGLPDLDGKKGLLSFPPPFSPARLYSKARGEGKGGGLVQH